VDNTPWDKLGVWRDMRLADALVLIVFPISLQVYIAGETTPIGNND